MIDKTKSAFTLSEVLITLVIIGIVAALTIPTAISKYQKQQYVSGLKKAYSTLKTVTNQIIAEEGTPKASVGGWASSPSAVYNIYKKHLSLTKDCGTGRGCVDQLSSNGTGASDGFNSLKTGKPVYNNYELNSTFYKVILSDGTQLIFDDYISPQRNCTHEELGSSEMCYAFFVDVNGEKGPNTWGKDVYYFALKEDGLYPGGCDSGVCDKNGSGIPCACRVIRENAINYY